jgi:drug/metabolite transporter (DMT)-like permease
VLAALAGACVFGVTGALQQRATRRVPAGEGRGRGFVRGLLRQPVWLLSTIGSVGGFGLQGVALGTGPIALVQPVLVTGVLFAATAGFLLRRRDRPRDRPRSVPGVDAVFLLALLATVGGLAVFLVVARPIPGEGLLTVRQLLPLAIGLGAGVVGCVGLASRTSGTVRSLALALATGIVYGVTAAVAKVTISTLHEGPAAVLTHWSLWVLVVIGPLGFLINQHAFREGELVSPVVAVITVTDPLVGIAVGLLWLGERLHSGPGAIVGELAGLALMAGGVWVVASRAPHLTGETADGAAQPAQPPDRRPGGRDSAR